MNKYELVSKIEEVAPLETQEGWDCSGWIVDNEDKEVSKIMLALTITDDIMEQARAKKCDFIISHHPLFEVPIKYRDINIYSSHTPLDKARGGTTDSLISALGLKSEIIIEEFVRVVECDLLVSEFIEKLKKISTNLRVVNNKKTERIRRIGFCAGSGSEFINEIECDAFVTGDVKYHTAVESDKVIFDIGHFESEILVLKFIETILGIEVEYANEKSPFI